MVDGCRLGERREPVDVELLVEIETEQLGRHPELYALVQQSAQARQRVAGHDRVEGVRLRSRRASTVQSAPVVGVGSVGVRRARYCVIWYVVIAGGWISVSRAEATRSDAVPAGTGE